LLVDSWERRSRVGEDLQHPDLVVEENLLPVALGCVLLLALVGVKTGEETGAVFLLEPGVLGWEMWHEDEDEDGEEHGDETLNDENPSPSGIAASLFDIGNGICK
jgi:hypothetical protein